MNCRPARPEDLEWLVARSTAALTPKALGLKVTDGEKIVGMCVFDGWTPNAVQMHVALDNPLAGRALLVPAFACAFISFARNVVLADVAACNAKCVRLVHGLGFVEARRTLDGWDTGVDLLHFEMRKAWCRWLPSRQPSLREGTIHGSISAAT